MKATILQRVLKIAKERNTPTFHPEYGNFHHFSFIVQNNKIKGFATNTSGTVKYSGFYSRLSKSHSEANAYSKTVGILARNTSFEIINIRLNKSNQTKLSKPCPCCIYFLQSVGCSKVWFSCDNDLFARLSL